MNHFRKTVDIWTLNREQRAHLRPGQWVTGGGALGRWVGQTKGSDVVAWNENAKRHPLGFHGYWRNLRSYQRAYAGETKN